MDIKDELVKLKVVITGNIANKNGKFFVSAKEINPKKEDNPFLILAMREDRGRDITHISKRGNTVEVEGFCKTVYQKELDDKGVSKDIPKRFLNLAKDPMLLKVSDILTVRAKVIGVPIHKDKKTFFPVENLETSFALDKKHFGVSVNNDTSIDTELLATKGNKVEVSGYLQSYMGKVKNYSTGEVEMQERTFLNLTETPKKSESEKITIIGHISKSMGVNSMEIETDRGVKGNTKFRCEVSGREYDKDKSPVSNFLVNVSDQYFGNNSEDSLLKIKGSIQENLPIMVTGYKSIDKEGVFSLRVCENVAIGKKEINAQIKNKKEEQDKEKVLNQGLKN